MALSHWEEAEKQLNLLISNGKKTRDTLLLLVQVLRGTKRFEESLAVINAASREYPEELFFRLEEARILLDMGRPQEALSAFRVCAPILRSESDYYECALAHFQTNLHDQCWLLINEWLPHSQNGKLLALGGDCLFEKNQFQAAIGLYTRAIEKTTSQHQIMSQLGHSYRKLGNLAAAETIFKQILDKDSQNVSATLGLGACLQERGHYLKALLFYQSLASWEKHDFRILQQAGLCALICKKYILAIDYLGRVVRSHPPSAQLLFYYGYSLEGACQWQEAEQVYLQLVHAFPSDPRGYRALGWLYGVGLSRTLSVEQGLNFAYVALKLIPDVVSWEILSACEARRGHFQRAHQIQEYLLTLENEPSFKQRRQHAMRTLRKQVPLDGQQVFRSQVA